MLPKAATLLLAIITMESLECELTMDLLVQESRSENKVPALAKMVNAQQVSVAKTQVVEGTLVEPVQALRNRKLVLVLLNLVLRTNVASASLVLLNW